MSNKSRLQTNNTNLQALINKANALPDAGGGSGGGSVETCNLSLTPGTTATIVYNTIDDSGNIVAQCVTGGYFPDLVAVCDTSVVIIYSMPTSELMFGGNNTELLQKTSHSFIIKLTANAGEDARVFITYGSSE
jgi:hypothetical protein